MRKLILAVLLLAGSLCLGLAAEGHNAAAHAGPAEPGLPTGAVRLVHDNFFVSNSMLVTWIVAAGLILFAQIATKNIQAVPGGAQNFWEWLVESLYEFLEGIIGRELEIGRAHV